MVLRITNKCYFKCYHCMYNSNGNGENMTENVFMDSMNFMIKHKVKVVLISGVEPTLHPKLNEWIKSIKDTTNMIVLLASNGWYITENGDIPESFKTQADMVQITNDARYYPMRINAVKNHPDYKFVDSIEELVKCSKLKHLDNDKFNQNPKCFNIRFNGMRGMFEKFSDIIKLQESILKICTPLIGIDGKIYIGETDLCKPIGSIYDSEQNLMKKIRTQTCNNCGFYDNFTYNILMETALKQK